MSDLYLESECLAEPTDQGEIKLSQNNKTPSISVRGRLKKCVSYWTSIGASKFILDVTEFGYKIPFLDTPVPYIGKNNASAREHQSFVDDAITELLTLNCIEEINERPSIVNPLSVSVQSSGKKRLILDLRHVNKYVYKQRFKCADIKTLIQLIDKEYYMFKFDLKSAYHHIEIYEEHRKFLSFAWSLGDSGVRYFQFCVLPFGLSSAPFIFTKLLKPLITVWRKQGIPIVVYLDDGLGAGRNPLLAKSNSLIVHSGLLAAGFITNEPKSVWDPVQETIWLGYNINTRNNTIQATQKRIDKLRSALTRALQSANGSMNVKDLASVVGQIISLEMAVGNVVRLLTRSAYRLINSCSSWNDRVQLDSATEVGICILA